MTIRTIKTTVSGNATVDGAGVHLVRVLGPKTVNDFDPFLMLDSFDSKNPDDYIKGFPLHPHRGIETITYLIEGEMEHKDSLGNSGVIRSGESQWMTAGSGIMHMEMPKASPRMLGLQIWLNLPKSKKMTHPTYFGITSNSIPLVKTDFGQVKVISGIYGEKEGVKPSFIKATLLDVLIKPSSSAIFHTPSTENTFIFLMEGPVVISGKTIPEKTAVLFGSGDTLEVESTSESQSRFIFFSAIPLKEPVAWGGPIVMNTDEELKLAFDELQKGTFIKENAGPA
jgi:redox-sensitive bicupin YhaK (pirin superfamily)